MTTPATPLPRVLCIDDEQHVLEGLQRLLRRRFDVVTADSAAEGLQRLNEDPAFAVVMSDLSMPGGNGIDLLARVRELAPDATRILLTGHADVRAAVAAVNEGQVYRFLTKPCPADPLIKALDAAVEQHRLVTAERVLLEQTLRGSIKALVDVLALARPEAFGRATRIKNLVSSLAQLSGATDLWQMEVAALLSQIGAVSLPPDTLDHLLHGQLLTPEESARVAEIPSLAAKLIEGIPRLEGVREILRQYDAPAAKPPGGTVPLGARMLRVALDYDDWVTRGHAPDQALSRLYAKADGYDPTVLSLLEQVIGVEAGRNVAEIRLTDVREGMIFVDDVYAVDGTLLIARGQEASPGLVNRIHSFWQDLEVRGPVRVVTLEPIGLTSAEAETA
jgi:response regulator RpfG family c-di-GMP phosphodiesterase